MENALINGINSHMEIVAKWVEVCGVVTMLIGGIFSTARFFLKTFRKEENTFEEFRNSLGRAILLGLEFLVIGDIVGTIAVKPTFESLGVLALIVLIRTFLSFSLEVEIKGQWPWSSNNQNDRAQL